MTDFDPNDSVPDQPATLPTDVEPSWKPLFWVLGIVMLMLILEEVFFEIILEIFEFIGEAIFFVVEGSEEHLEDKIEEWFELDPYHAEIVTAWSLTPVKIFLGFLALRWLWKLMRRRLFPWIAASYRRHSSAVRLAWRLLFWPYKILAVVVTLGILVILI